MPTCPTCGASHPPGALFCPNCGSALPLTCAVCGEPALPGALFCTRCGTRLPDVAAGRPAIPAPAAVEERKVVTVLFADLVRSTELADRLDPETMRQVLRTYFDAMRAEIEAEGGTVEKYVGDAVMAVFGVPLVHEDDPERAVRAALAMVRRLDEVNTLLGRSYDVALRLRIGINTGSVLATLDGPPGEGMVTGDMVNVASRLQTSAEPGEIVVSERTARAARSFAYADRGGLELKGKREPVRAFAVSGPSTTPTRGVPDLRAPMVGRDTEMGVLRSVLERTANERRPHLVTVYGEPGVGKSRLVREFLAAIDEDDPAPLVMRGRCLPYGDGITYWPLAEILKAQASVRDTDDQEVALKRIRGAVEELLEDDETGADPVETAEALAYTLGLRDPDSPFPWVDPLVVKKRLHLAWKTFFTATAASGPVVVVVEDIHWADEALLELLDELADRVEGPVLLVCPSRPDLVVARPTWGGGRRNAVSVALDPLGDADAERLVRLLLDVDDLPGSVHARILERGEGNPFFIEEILRRLIDEGLVVRQDGRWRAVPGVETVDIPDTVQGVLAARIDLLDPAAKRALQAAAVVGRVFWPEPLAVLTGDDDGALTDELCRLEERDLVLSRLGSALAGQPEYAFKHILTRDVAYDGIPRRERSGAHAAVAQWLERATRDRAGEFSDLLAYHYSTAVELARESAEVVSDDLRRSAWTWLLKASVDARSRHVLRRAQRNAQESLDLAASDPERCSSLEALGEAFAADSRGDLAWQYLREAALVADASPDIGDDRTANLLARACELPVRWPGSMRGAPPEPEVRALIERGLALVPPGDNLGRARLLATRAGWPFAFPEAVREEDLDGYRSDGLEALEMARRLGDFDAMSAALDQAPAADTFRGRYGSVIQLWRQRWELRDHLTADLEIGDLYAMGAWIHFETGRYEESTRYARDIIGRSGETTGGIHARSWHVAALFRLGRWDDAMAEFDRMREVLDDRRDNPPNYASHAFAVAATVHRLRGERLDSDRLNAVVESLQARSTRAYPWRVWLRLARGDVAGAIALDRQRPAPWRVHEALVWEAHADALLAGRRWAGASGIAQRMRAYAVEADAPSTPAFADRLEGTAALSQQQYADAVDLLTRSATTFAALSAPWERARTERLLVVALDRMGRTDDAAAVAVTSAETLHALRAVDDAVIDRALGALA